jgi:hypothetical protein
MTPFIIGFGGVLAGALLTGLVKTWGQVIDARSAASIIRMEIQDNMQRAVLAVTNSRTDIRLRDDAWKGHRLQLVPLLPREALHHLSVTYGAYWIMDDWIARCVEKPKEAKQEIETWFGNSGLDSGFLLRLCERSRLAQLFDVLLSRPTFPKPNKGEESAQEQLAELKAKAFEAAANKRDASKSSEVTQS